MLHKFSESIYFDKTRTGIPLRHATITMSASYLYTYRLVWYVRMPFGKFALAPNFEDGKKR